jgi:hypothetical protein
MKILTQPRLLIIDEVGYLGLDQAGAVKVYKVERIVIPHIEKLTEVQNTIEQLLALLQASEHDRFAAHLYPSRREYRSACQRAGKSDKQIERCVISRG